MGKANNPCLPCSLICWFYISTYLNKSLPRTRPSVWCPRPLSSRRWLFPSFRSRVECHLPKEAIPVTSLKKNFLFYPFKPEHIALGCYFTALALRLSYSFIVWPSISPALTEWQLPESWDPGCLVHYNIPST